MRMASVPVVGYLSFLASNSPMANDFIALLDHLHQTNQYQNINPTKLKHQTQYTKFNRRHSLGHFVIGRNSFLDSVTIKSEASETTARHLKRETKQTNQEKGFWQKRQNWVYLRCREAEADRGRERSELWQLGFDSETGCSEP